jgi:hypothetical protein
MAMHTVCQSRAKVENEPSRCATARPDMTKETARARVIGPLFPNLQPAWIGVAPVRFPSEENVRGKPVTRRYGQRRSWGAALSL